MFALLFVCGFAARAEEDTTAYGKAKTESRTTEPASDGALKFKQSPGQGAPGFRGVTCGAAGFLGEGDDCSAALQSNQGRLGRFQKESPAAVPGLLLLHFPP